MKKRNKDVAPHMQRTSVSLPKTMLAKIQDMAEAQDRSRNKMVELLLREVLENDH